MSTLELRNAELGDAPAIQHCIADAYADAMRDIADLPDVTDGIEDAIRTHQVVVAEGNGKLFGVIMFDRHPDAMMILNLAVSREAQGRGVAGTLLTHAEASAAKEGVLMLRLRTHRLMTETRAMYAHLGWEEVEALGNSVVMQKAVS